MNRNESQRVIKKTNRCIRKMLATSFRGRGTIQFPWAWAWHLTGTGPGDQDSVIVIT